MLSSTERDEVLRSTMSYYPTDLLVLGWVGAVVYDAPEAAGPTIELLEYANTQLLEFRYYDEVLTRVLSDAYKRLEKRQTDVGPLEGSTRSRKLEHDTDLDYQELVERTNNAIKFLSDMFYARMYELAAKPHRRDRLPGPCEREIEYCARSVRIDGERIPSGPCFFPRTTGRHYSDS